MSNLFDKKVSVNTPNTTLSPAASVAVNMGVAAIYSLTLNQNTTITVTTTNTFNGDVTLIRVTGNFLLSFIDAGKTFVGDVDGAGLCLTYNGTKNNTVQIVMLAPTVFGVYCLTDKA